jgi:hypothetical protein
MLNYYIILCLVIYPIHFVSAQDSHFFEGKLVYQTTTYYPNGKTDSTSMPKSEYYIKNGNILYRLEDNSQSFMPDLGSILILSEKGEKYNVSHAERKNYKLNTKMALDTNLRIERTNDTAVVLNYKCVKYIITATNNQGGGKVNSEVWVTNYIRIKNVQKLALLFGGKSDLLYNGNLDGIPLKLISTYPDGIKVMSEIVSVLEDILDNKLFTLNPKYEVVIE